MEGVIAVNLADEVQPLRTSERADRTYTSRAPSGIRSMHEYVLGASVLWMSAGLLGYLYTFMEIYRIALQRECEIVRTENV
ncbi:hypothetical protein BD309DRAFT_950500 [Dichomitus squalens]|uniref:Uncharacterized protein n=1 Tax=Dichomitus squalens TaxID=114155 RepID=A0A4Q9PXE4_9APHY|nr:hypothetical protein BD309DRAFT_950500 [Dichomitus squalens]TBU59387.1 hypothetical protein BD310DRAFT_925010 [Dichomitus squalens]